MPIIFKEVTVQKEWDEFFFQNGSTGLFQSWIWSEVQKRVPQTCWRVGLYEANKLCGIALVTKVVAKRGSYLHVRHGPILLPHKTNQWKYWTEYLKKLGKKEQVFFIRISPQLPNSVEITKQFHALGFVDAPIHAMDAELCWVLDIDHTEEELLSGMRKSTRYEIRKAEGLGVQVRQSKTVSDLSEFQALYTQTYKRHGFIPHSHIQEEFEVFLKHESTSLFIGSVGDTVYAAAIIEYLGDQAIYHHGASLPSKYPVSTSLQWAAIAEARKRGKKLYNFWGIAPEEGIDHPWKGITAFKKGFGGREVQYIHALDLPISPLYIIPKSIDLVRKILKGY